MYLLFPIVTPALSGSSLRWLYAQRYVSVLGQIPVQPHRPRNSENGLLYSGCISITRDGECEERRLFQPSAWIKLARQMTRSGKVDETLLKVFSYLTHGTQNAARAGRAVQSSVCEKEIKRMIISCNFMFSKPIVSGTRL